MNLKRTKEEKSAYLAYILMACTSIFTIAGLIYSLINLKKSEGSIFYSHYKWLINTFIFSLPFFILLTALSYLVIFMNGFFGGFISYAGLTLGWLLLIGWWTMRLMLGLLELNDNKAIEFDDFK